MCEGKARYAGSIRGASGIRNHYAILYRDRAIPGHLQLNIHAPGIGMYSAVQAKEERKENQEIAHPETTRNQVQHKTHPWINGAIVIQLICWTLLIPAIEPLSRLTVAVRNKFTFYER